MPIISFAALGTGFLIRFFGPESMGGIGDLGARIDAEVARTGLSADEIGPKVRICIIFLDGLLSDLVSKVILPYTGRRETHSFPDFLQCMTTNFPHRRYCLIVLTELILIETYGLCQKVGVLSVP